MDNSNSQLRMSQRAMPIFLGVGGVVAAVFLAYIFAKLWPIAVIVLISLMLVAALTPIVRRIQQKYSRKTAITLVTISLLIVIMGAIVLTIPPVAEQLTTIGADFDKVFAHIRSQLSETAPAFAKMLDQVKVAIPSQAQPQAVREFLLSAFTLITSFVTILMLSTYLLVEGPSVATSLVSFFPRNRRLHVRQMFGEIADQVGAYIRGQLITSLMAGIATYAILVAFGIPGALAMGWLMAIADAIPIVGPLVGIIPPVVAAFNVSGEKAIYVVIALAVYHQLEHYYIVPRVYGKALKLSPVVVLLAILVGTSLLGMVGAFLALPFAAAVPILMRYFSEWREEDDEPVDLPGESATKAADSSQTDLA